MGIPVKLEVFEGPLDLLLHLIDKNKVNIYDIPIVTITEQYMEYIDAMNESFRALRLRMTSDEKIIFKYSILSRHTDEEIAERLSLDKSSIYQRKKSCYIKVAKYYHIEVFN